MEEGSKDCKDAFEAGGRTQQTSNGKSVIFSDRFISMERVGRRVHRGSR